MRQTRRGAAGFSMIELMITLSIAAILLAVALPSLRGLIEGGRISGTTNDLVYALQLARSEAIKRAAPARLCPSSAPMATSPVCAKTGLSSGWIVVVDSDVSGTLDDTDRVVLQREPIGGAVSLTATTALQEGVRFDASGNSVSAAGGPNPGNVLIALPGGESRTVTVRASGRIGSKVGSS